MNSGKVAANTTRKKLLLPNMAHLHINVKLHTK